MTRNMLKCNRCGNVWVYTGTNYYVTSCSKCKTSVSIRKNTVCELDILGCDAKVSNSVESGIEAIL